MANFQLTGSQRVDKKMLIQTSIQNYYVSLSQGFQKHLSNSSHKHGILDYGKHKKWSSKPK